jgi:hypothetical protein
MSTYLTKLSAPIALALMLNAPVAQSALVVNGGFEAPDVASWMLLPAGSTHVTGWTVVGNTISFQDNVAFGGLGVVGSEGQQFLDLSGIVGRGGGVRSDAIATTAGASYQLQFDLGAFFVSGQGSFGNATVDLWIDGVAQGSYTNLLGLTSPGSDWETQSLIFVATGASTSLEFRSSLSLLSSDLGVGLDNIRLDALAPANVPEPGSAWLLLGGLLGLAGRVRRSGR